MQTSIRIAYERIRTDLSDDGFHDLIVQYYSGLVGIAHDVQYFAIYLGCPDGQFREARFDAFSRVEPAPQADATGYRPIKVSCDCRDTATQQIVTRTYQLRFDTFSGRYEPPDGVVELEDFCGAYEQSLPAQPWSH